MKKDQQITADRAYLLSALIGGDRLRERRRTRFAMPRLAEAYGELRAAATG